VTDTDATEGLATYTFPTGPSGGILFGLSGPRLTAVGLSGLAVLVAVMGTGTSSRLAAMMVVAVLLVATFAKVAHRPLLEWVPVIARYGWAQATRTNEFYRSPDLETQPLPDEMLDLPGELFGIELHDLTINADTPADHDSRYGILRDVWRKRVIAVAEVSGDGFVFDDPADQQQRVDGWGSVLDQVAATMPEIVRLQVVHTAGPASVEALARHHATAGGHGTNATATSYRQVIERAGQQAQEHRMLLAVALDERAARTDIRQAGGRIAGAANVLLDRAARIESQLTASGLQVCGWLPASTIAAVLRVAFDPAAHNWLPTDDHGNPDVSQSACGPWAINPGWAAVQHDSGWSTSFEVVRPPARPVTPDFLQHLLIGVPAQRRLSLLHVPLAADQAERDAKSRQISADAEATIRSRFGFGVTRRQEREHDDATRQEDDVVDGRAMFRLVWLLTVTAPDPHQLETAAGQVEAAARKCRLEVRRTFGMQRQAAGFTLPLCRGAR